MIFSIMCLMEHYVIDSAGSGMFVLVDQLARFMGQ